MPLMQGKSKKAFSHNVGAEMDAGKPQNQALAIAYSIKRKKMAKGGYPVEKDENYAEGGEVNNPNGLMPDPDKARQAAAGAEHGETLADGWQNLKNAVGLGSKPQGYAGGGMVNPRDLAMRIRAKRMAAGGEVDDDFLSDEENTELPDESEAGEQPEDKRKRMLSKAFEMVRQRHTGLLKK